MESVRFEMESVLFGVESVLFEMESVLIKVEMNFCIDYYHYFVWFNSISSKTSHNDIWSLFHI